MRLRAGISFLVVIGAALLCAMQVWNGIPTLRQDWASPAYWDTWTQPLFAASGWQQAGIGSASPYLVSQYFVALMVATGSALIGGHATVFVLLFLIGMLCAAGGRAIAMDAGCGKVGASAAALFASLNPWVYTKLIAGHPFMILAYGASLWFSREIVSKKPRASVLICACVLTLQQIQFYVIALIALAINAVIRKQWKPLLVAVLLWLPVAIGMALDSQTLTGMPFVLGWERSQSVRPFDALELVGYFTNYASVFNGPLLVPVSVTCAFAIVGARTLRFSSLFFLGITIAVLVFVTGTKGVAAPVFAWAVENFRPLAVYRELYDLLAIAAIGYTFLAVRAVSASSILQWVWFLVVLILPLAWFQAPPSHFWVAASERPLALVGAQENTRFALIPAFQPMSLGGRGSGADPDFRIEPRNVTPLNEYLADYPVSQALAEFDRKGDVLPLEALSASRVIVRPWLQSDTAALQGQSALPLQTAAARPTQLLAINAFPELSLLAPGDARIDDWKNVRALVPPNREIDAASGWVDVRFAYAARPDLAQPLGGALTTNRQKELPVSGGSDALVFVEGELLGSDGRQLARNTSHYQWVVVPPAETALKCEGLCVVAAQGHAQRIASFSAAARGAGVNFSQLLPWLAVAEIPSGSAAVLRYNVRYDPHWEAFLGGVFPKHVRLEGIVNGWILDARKQASDVWLVHSVSLWQCCAQLFGVFVLLILCMQWWAGGSRARDEGW